MPTFWCKREGEYRLAVDSRSSALELARLPKGKLIRVEAKVPRHGKHHRLICKAFSLVAEALNEGPTNQQWDVEGVMEYVKLATGHIEIFKLPKKAARKYGTETGVRPKSIAFDKMDQSAFETFAYQALTLIRDELAPWLEDAPQWIEIQDIFRRAKLEEQ